MTDPDLFDVRRKAEKPKPKPETAGAVGRLLGLHRQLFEQRTGEPPVILTSDGPVLKRLVTRYGEEAVTRRLRAFHGLEDSFIQDSGYALATFERQWNRLAVQETARRPDRRSSEATATYLRNLRHGRQD